MSLFPYSVLSSDFSITTTITTTTIYQTGLFIWFRFVINEANPGFRFEPLRSEQSRHRAQLKEH